MTGAKTPPFDDTTHTGYTHIFSPSTQQKAPSRIPSTRVDVSVDTVPKHNGNYSEIENQSANVNEAQENERTSANCTQSSTVPARTAARPLSDSLRRAMEDDDNDDDDQKLWSRDSSRRHSDTAQMSWRSGSAPEDSGSAGGGSGVRGGEQGGPNPGDSGGYFRGIPSSSSDISAAGIPPDKPEDGEKPAVGGFKSALPKLRRGYGTPTDPKQSKSAPGYSADADAGFNYTVDFNAKLQESMLAQAKKSRKNFRDSSRALSDTTSAASIGSELLKADLKEMWEEEGGEDGEGSGAESGYRGPTVGAAAGEMVGEAGVGTVGIGGSIRKEPPPSAGSPGGRGGAVGSNPSPLSGKSSVRGRKPEPVAPVVIPQFNRGAQKSFTQIFDKKAEEKSKRPKKPAPSPQGSGPDPVAKQHRDAGSMLLASPAGTKPQPPQLPPHLAGPGVRERERVPSISPEEGGWEGGVKGGMGGAGQLKQSIPVAGNREKGREGEGKGAGMPGGGGSVEKEGVGFLGGTPVQKTLNNQSSLPMPKPPPNSCYCVLM